MPSDPQVGLFILHSEADDNWVEHWLIPRLTDAGMARMPVLIPGMDRRGIV